VEPQARQRAHLLFLSLIIILGALSCRAAYLQVVGNRYYSELKEKQQIRRTTLFHERGKILDVKGRTVALSIPVQSLYADPRRVKDREESAKAVAAIVGCNEQNLLKKLQKERSRFVWVKRHLDEDLVAKIEALELCGFGFRKEYRRLYPNGNLCSHLIGGTDIDQVGIDGLEWQYDNVLTGRDGWRVLSCDAGRREFATPEMEGQMPLPGKTIQLTIDLVVQAIVQEVIGKTFTEWKADSVSAAVIDPFTGAILAMANVPDFDPNRPGDYPDDNRRNRCLTDSFEPGSMNKPFIVSSALERNVVSPQTRIDCEKGYWRYRSRKISDVHPYGFLTVEDVIAKSSNIGTTKIGLLLQESSQNNLIRDTMLALGFGSLTGVDLPGEEAGRVTPENRWSYHSDVSVCFGYEVAVSPLQMTCAMSVVANRGVLMKPFTVKAILDSEGKTLQEINSVFVRRVYEPETMDTVSKILKRVVTDGTAKRVSLKDYTIAGKTGTSHKVQNGRYVNEYFSSFIGYAPVERPKIIVLVSVNNPRGRSHYGATVAGPAVKEIIDRILRYFKTDSAKEASYIPTGFKLEKYE